MDTNNYSSGDNPFTLLPDHQHDSVILRRPLKGLAGIFLSMMILSSLVALIFNSGEESSSVKLIRDDMAPLSRDVVQGVSEKAVQGHSNGASAYNWTNAMLTWQRTAYHFQPHKNWMNDPSGPLFHMGWYHLFYQYNPYSAIRGNLTWGHAVSRDLIHWLYLPISMVPDHWFDINGVWTGSATLLPDGHIIILYTGDTDDLVQVQNLAYPANLSDPLLLNLVKYENNPIMVPPPGIGPKDFRDPTTAWKGKDGKWRVAIGSKVNTTGIILVYHTDDNFTSYDLLDGVMHAVPGTGIWECLDFYPVSTVGINGLDTSFDGPGVKHVLKVSLDDEKNDFYALGTYFAENDTWTPDNPDMDVGIGLRVDYGTYYASKSFYDQNKERRILWGWVGETDNTRADLLKGWASVQAVPRTVVFDEKTKTNIIQWPVKEIESLRLNSREFSNVTLGPGSIVPLNITAATQLDITATFDIEREALEATLEADVVYNCSTSSAASRGVLGPFGLLVIADDSLSEFTPIYFYIAKDTYVGFNTFFCADELKSTMARDVNKQVFGSTVPVLDGEKLSMRLLVDHSIVESFAQGGRTVITSRIYPTKAIFGAARVFLFNNATGISVTASLKAWEMDSADIHPFPLEQI